MTDPDKTARAATLAQYQALRRTDRIGAIKFLAQNEHAIQTAIAEKHEPPSPVPEVPSDSDVQAAKHYRRLRLMSPVAAADFRAAGNQSAITRGNEALALLDSDNGPEAA